MFFAILARRVVFVVCCCTAFLAVAGQSGNLEERPRATADHVDAAEWWPTKGTPAFEAYAGKSGCGKCHSKESGAQGQTPMASAAFRMGGNSQGQKIGPESFRSGSYLYRVSSDNFSSKLVVSSGKQSIAADIEWIMGTGVHGQTYILGSNGTLYESQVSRFSGLQGMDITPGHPPTEEGNLQNALGERLSASTGSRCFACHTTASTTKNQFDPKRATPGITCEACHGPGLSHIVVATMGQTDEAKTLILNPRSLSPVDSIDFCGACHRTSVDVVMAKSYGVSNVRFQPYRLEKSRCWKARADERLVCIACHNPHEPLVRTASFYDQPCLSCHRLRGEKSGGASKASDSKASDLVCPKATAECPSCHMPKYDVPEMHAKFTDHFIRIVRAGEPYPN